MYHRFEENRYPSTNIRLRQFEAQLDYLAQEGFTVWPLRRLLDAIFSGKAVPDKTVALTVDDAYLSVYRHAYPLVRERGLPLTVFVSTDAVDRSQRGYMSWAQMREMQRHGIDFANHGAAHLHLHEQQQGEDEKAWRQRVAADIRRAQRRLDSELGEQGMKLLAYPFGEFNCALGKLVREMGSLGLGQHSGAIGPLSRREALPRFPINEQFAALEKFAIKAASLPLPVASQRPREPQLGETNPPALTLQLAAGYGELAARTTCYLGDGTPLEVLERGAARLTVRAASPLRQGRSRYNCTAPAGNGRYYWFSQPWSNGPDAADPGR
jgi:peptidoglycan/xylan/chitin deacetylase (PgdA/CDA1 family)